MKRTALNCAFRSRAYERYGAHGRGLDQVAGRRPTLEAAAQRAHQRSGRHESISVADRFGDDGGSSRLRRVYA